ncbi:MAG: 30S ribosomal protein S14 [Phycisphaeraceae bacterium]
MATKSTKEKMKRIAATIAKYRERRTALKAAGDWAGLQKLPRDSSPTRLRNICAMTGRSRSVYRKFRLSRLMLRKLALEGKVPGMRKASW